MAGTLYDLLPPARSAGSDELLGRFLDYVAGKGLTLYPAQEEAILEAFRGEERHPEHSAAIIVGLSALAALYPVHAARRLEPREALHHVF